MGKLGVLIVSSFISAAVFAAPVVDITSDDSSQQALVQAATNDANAPVDTSDMSVEQRLTRLENLVNAQGQMQLMQRLQQFQQQVEILQGQNEVLQHELKKLQQRQDYLYQQLASGGKIALPAKDQTADASIPADQQAYQQAYALISQNNYSAAVKALQAFVKKYPKSPKVANALYWQGEVLAAQGNDDQAQAALQQLIQQFPNDPQIADAQLKLATIAINNDKLPQARQLLQTIIKQRPNTAEASIAASKLRLIKGQ
jgi:tol-pal system protein YbgF